MTRRCGAPDCGKTLVRRVGEMSGDFKKRLSCGPSCGSKMPRNRPNNERRGECPFCGGGTRIKANHAPPASCNKPECRKRAYQAKPRKDEYRAWPQTTGVIPTSFHAHNIVPRDDYGSLPGRPVTLVLKSSSIA